MREIIFRGKAFNRGSWVYGSLISMDKEIGRGQVFIYPPSSVERSIPCVNRIQTGIVSVDANTLGQYTGFTDSNGKKIFEGDILEFVSYREVHKGIVKYLGTTFCVVTSTNDESEIYSMKFVSECKKVVVVGNIYDGKKSSVKQYSVAFYDMNKNEDCFDETFYSPDEVKKVLSFVERENDPFASEKSRAFAHFEDGSVYELKLEKC